MYKDIRKMVTDFIPNLPYTCKGIVFYTLKKCSNFALIIPKADQIEIKTPNEINDIVQEKWPKLWDRKYNTSMIGMISMNNSTINTNSDANSDSGNSDYSSNTKNTNTESITIADDNVVFKILNTGIPDIYNLYCLDKSTMYKHSIALVPNIKISHYLYYTFKENSNNLEMNNLENNTGNTGNIGIGIDMYVECKFSKIFEKWTPIRFVNQKPYNRNDIEAIEERLKAKEN
jgi:hypothetical protein